MRTIMLIKQLLKDSDLSSVSFRINDDSKLIIQTEPLDIDLQEKIQSLLDREINLFLNSID